jgi:hypothetical protein
MGYFATLAEAQHWSQLMRGTYPSAVASAAPAAVLQQRASGVPTLSPASPDPAPSEDKSLTDTHVLQILETRRVAPMQDGTAERHSGAISLLRPDDTDTRRVLKEAVVQGTPVSFAVQLHWSVQPIDLTNVPALPIFRAYQLYLTEGRRDGRSWHCLRLGIFNDAISAKQVAYYVRSNFASIAVVPISEQERTHANENRIDSSALADPVQQRIDQILDSGRARTNPSPGSAPKSDRANARSAGAPTRAAETLEQTLELLAASEIWTDSDSLSETGVRHLKVDVRKRTSKRS